MGGDFQVKIFFLYLGVHLGHEIPYAYAQSNFKENFLLSLGKNNFFRGAFEMIC